MNVAQLEEFLYWSMLINIGLLTLSSVLIMLLKDFVCRMHAKLFGLKEESVLIIMYSYLGVYKLLVITFNIVPWLALNMIQ